MGGRGGVSQDRQIKVTCHVFSSLTCAAYSKEREDANLPEDWSQHIPGFAEVLSLHRNLVRAFTMHFVRGSSQINSNIKNKKLPESLNAIPKRYMWDVAEYKKPTFVRWTENQVNCFSGWWDLRPRWEFLSILILSELLISLLSSSVHRI